MGMPAAQMGWTAAMVRALPEDGKRYEVAGGELLVTPAPRFVHQRAVGHLFVQLATFVDGSRLGVVMMSPADIEFSARRLLQPDIFVAPRREGRLPRSWGDVHSLLLAIEVISPSTARADRWLKRRIYQDEGVGEYWIVDLDARLVERWRPADERPELIHDTLEWAQNDAHLAPFVLELPRFFAQVLDD